MGGMTIEEFGCVVVGCGGDVIGVALSHGERGIMAGGYIFPILFTGAEREDGQTRICLIFIKFKEINEFSEEDLFKLSERFGVKPEDVLGESGEVERSICV